MTENFFAELKEWSTRKHALLTNYLMGFTKILGGSKGVVYYVDGFAGPGLYGENNDKGSPVLAAEYAISLINKAYTLQCINIEADDKYFKNLEGNTRPYQQVVTNFQGTFAQNVDNILTQISTHPILFFLDPFGIKDIEWDILIKILKRSPITELLLRIDPVIISRLAGFYDFEGKKGGEAKLQRLNKFLGVNPQISYPVWQTGREKGLINFLLESLG